MSIRYRNASEDLGREHRGRPDGREQPLRPGDIVADRAIILTCSGVDQPHVEAVVAAWTFPDRIGTGEFVSWSPVPEGSVLEMFCDACPGSWWLNAGNGNTAFRRMEIASRTVGRVVLGIESVVRSL